MMKKNLLYLLLFIGALFSACSDTDPEYLFDKSINDRFAELQAESNSKLTAPENGWLGYYSPNGETGAFSLLLKFHENGTVIMHSDYAGGFANDTITYSIKKQQDMTLVFESWSVLHSIYETNNNNFGGEYVFKLTEVTDDKILLTSKTDDGYGDDDITELTLTPATAENWNLEPVYENANRLAGDATKSIFRNFEQDDQAFASFRYDAEYRTGVITYLKDGELIHVTVPIMIDAEGFQFMEEVEIEGRSMKSFVYNADEDVFENADASIKLSYGNAPAFTAEGAVDDFLAMNFKSVTGYSVALQEAILLLIQDVPNFWSFQLYTDWGYLLCYAPGSAGGNWAGFQGLTYTKTAEDEILVTWEEKVYGSWWQNIYFNDGGQQFLNFILDENGLYVVPVNQYEVYLVSKSNPAKYCLVEL